MRRQPEARRDARHAFSAFTVTYLRLLPRRPPPLIAGGWGCGAGQESAGRPHLHRGGGHRGRLEAPSGAGQCRSPPRPGPPGPGCLWECGRAPMRDPGGSFVDDACGCLPPAAACPRQVSSEREWLGPSHQGMLELVAAGRRLCRLPSCCRSLSPEQLRLVIWCGTSSVRAGEPPE